MRRVFLTRLAVGWAAGLALLPACRPGPAEPQPEVLFKVPANFPAPRYDLVRNPVTADGFLLGKTLFYDARLSRDGTVSCGFCHMQGSAFSHHGHALSHGMEGRLGTRNAPGLANLAWQTSFMWDGGIHDLDLQAVAPIENPVEMDETLGNVLQKLRDTPAYPPLFKKAFGSGEITTERFLKAIAQFEVMLVSADSRYDRYVRGEGEPLTADERAGLRLFKANCAGCHATDLFTDHSFRNNGQPPGDDAGRFAVTLDPADRFRFKVPGLRNVAFTPPYMHDGRLLTLEAVLDHYTDGIRDSPTLDALLKPEGRPGIRLSAAEKRQVVAFLHTLSDEAFIRDPRFAEF